MVKKKYVIILLIFWGLIVIGFIATKQFTVQTGSEILLKTIPLDPRDLFRGDYVILRYDINRIHLDSIVTYEDSFIKDDQIYLKLEVHSKYALPTQISKQAFKDGLFIKGTVIDAYDKSLNINYGIESYFVKQGTGHAIERNMNNLDVKIAIDKFGNAIVLELVENDVQLE